MVAEYEAVKEEQRARIGFRDNLLYATLVSVAAVLTAAFKGDGRTDVLLLLPPVCVLLGWTYLINDEKISAIGRYVRKDLGPRLGAAAGTRDPVFGWETAHRSDPRRASRKLLQLGVDQLAFCIPSFVSLIVYWVSGPTHAALVVASAFEAVAVAVLAVQIVLYADLKSGP
ncbi:hypothetical protein ACFRCG_37350 [Embleya sp. NPDC056575]|uniref:hypothetical protein n=1 Tax=unclassified Embleya TaxID=2699296 RepID=UPI0036A61DC9